MTTRSLILVHGHPELSPGGGERAAFALFRHLKAIGGHAPLLAARATPAQIGHGAFFRLMRGRLDEVLATLPEVDPFTLLSRDPRRLGEILDELLALHAPSIAHVQHFAFWGVDVLYELRKRGLRIVMTLHEFLLICHRDGQMLTTNGKLCRQASAIACTTCFPEHSAGAFFVRKRILQKHLDVVDTFIAPSAFLADRFSEWGIDRRKIEVIENPLGDDQLEQADQLVARPGRKGSQTRLRLGYFGQVTPYKGLQVLLDAVELLSADRRSRIMVSVHGTMSAVMPEASRTAIEVSLRRLRRMVEWRGPYDAYEAINLMRDCDIIVVPSVWWENSPVVIQEARLAGRPVLCSDLGGLAEKAAEIPGSRTFRTGSVQDLALAIEDLLEVWDRTDAALNDQSVIERQKKALSAHRRAQAQLVDLIARTAHPR